MKKFYEAAKSQLRMGKTSDCTDDKLGDNSEFGANESVSKEDALGAIMMGNNLNDDDDADEMFAFDKSDHLQVDESKDGQGVG